ncbi:MAG: GTP cyclohydrolase I, partial [Agriterribacter sp.]
HHYAALPPLMLPKFELSADHLCVASRGIKDTNSITHTAQYSGQFENEATRQEFLSHIYNKR